MHGVIPIDSSAKATRLSKQPLHLSMSWKRTEERLRLLLLVTPGDGTWSEPYICAEVEIVAAIGRISQPHVHKD